MGRVRAVLVAGGALLTCAGVLGPQPAYAHSTLVASLPAGGSDVAAAPAQVRLTFDEPVSAGHALVTVTGPDGRQVQTGRAAVAGPVVTQALGPAQVPGRYRVAYRLSSVSDGHPVLGAWHFDLGGQGDGQDLATGRGGRAPGPARTATAPGLALAAVGGLLLLAGRRQPAERPEDLP